MSTETLMCPSIDANAATPMLSTMLAMTPSCNIWDEFYINSTSSVSKQNLHRIEFLESTEKSPNFSKTKSLIHKDPKLQIESLEYSKYPSLSKP